MSENLSGYELAWIVFVTVGLCVNVVAVVRALTNRAFARRALGGDWEASKERIVAGQRLRTTVLAMLGQALGLLLGLAAGTIAPQPVREGLQLFSTLTTFYILGLAGYLTVTPILDLLDDRRLLAPDAPLVPPAWADPAAVRERALGRLTSLLGVLGLVATAAIACYALVIWQDLHFQAVVPGGLPYTSDRFLGQFLRGLLNTIVSAALTGLVIGTVLVAYFRLRHEVDHGE